MSDTPESLPESFDTIDLLSAYLDSELDAAGIRQVEELIARDEQAREQLAELRAAWQLLDRLPRADLEKSFAQTTVEMVALAVAEPAPTPAMRRTRWLRPLAIVAGLAAAAAAGYGMTRTALPDRSRQLLADLPVIENLDAYRQAGSLDFLKRLAAAHLIDERQPPPGVVVESLHEVAPAERRQYIEQMKPGEKEQLLENDEWFAQLALAEQQELRKLAAELATEPDAAALGQLMLRYRQWLSRLSGIQRAELVQLEPAARIDRIRQLQTEQSRVAATWLSQRDLQAVFQWIEQVARENVSPEERAKLDAMNPEDRRRAITRWIWSRLQQPGAGARWLNLGPNDLRALSETLSPEPRRRLGQAAQAQQAPKLIGEWLRQALGMYGGGFRQGMNPGIPRERLKQFFEHELDETERQKLLDLPPDEMEQHIRRLYLLQHPTERPPPGAGPMNPGGPRDNQQRHDRKTPLPPGEVPSARRR